MFLKVEVWPPILFHFFNLCWWFWVPRFSIWVLESTCKFLQKRQLEFDRDYAESVNKLGDYCHPKRASLMAQSVKNLPAMQEMEVQSLVQEGPLEEDVATHSSISAWRIPWTEDPDRLHSVGSKIFVHNWNGSAQHAHTILRMWSLPIRKHRALFIWIFFISTFCSFHCANLTHLLLNLFVVFYSFCC